MRRLIINADDFGLTAGVNRAIVEAHEHGVVHSSTLMANGLEFDEAVRLANAVPGLSVGCHLVLVDGSPVLSAEKVPSLLDRKVDEGQCFRATWSGFVGAAVRGKLAAEEIEAEATAQIRKLQAAGIAVSHVDTHKHVHIFPQVLRPLLSAAKACGVPAIRNPFGPVRLGQLARWPGLWQRWIGAGTLNRLASGFCQTVKSAGLLAPDGTLGVVATGAWDERSFTWMVEHVPDGTWELVCHPGYVDAQLQNLRTRLRESRAEELRLLTAAATAGLLAQNQVELISYRDLR